MNLVSVLLLSLLIERRNGDEESHCPVREVPRIVPQCSPAFEFLLWRSDGARGSALVQWKETTARLQRSSWR